VATIYGYITDQLYKPQWRIAMNTKSIAITLPHEITKCLSRAEIYCADLILDLCRGTAKKVPSGAFYSCVGQKWLATRIGVTREWISHCVNKLQRFDIIRVTRRRKVNEQWTTNIYRAGDSLKMGWKTAKQRFLLAFVRVKSDTHIGTKKNESRKEMRKITHKSDNSKPESFGSIMTRCQQRIDSWKD